MSGMTACFWGTRGSIPTPGRRTERYGGNTTCLEVRCGDTLLILDAGSGIRELSLAWEREFGSQSIHASLLFTHLHWDHIQGFPFFAAAYRQGNSFSIYGEQRSGGTIQQLLGSQMGGDYFPVPLSNMKSQMEFRSIDGPFKVDDVLITPFPLPHPGGSLGFRIESNGHVLVLATDCELDDIAKNQEDIAADFGTRRQYDEKLLAYFRGAHLLVIDCQFRDEDYGECKGWGHNSLSTVTDLCAQVSPRMMALTHHDPKNGDERVDDLVNEAIRRLQLQGHDETLVFGAREQLRMTVDLPKRPPAMQG